MNNGIKYLIAGLVATGLTVSASYATITVNWGANDLSFVTDNTGAANYLTGAEVEIGTFAVAPTVGSSSLAGFSVFATDTTSAGSWSASSSLPSDTGFAHTQLYLVVFNGATPGASTQLAIASVNFANNANWKIPASTDVPNFVTTDVDDLFATPGTSANTSPGTTIFFGSTGLDPAGFSLLETAPTAAVPEPSTYVLVGTGLLGLLGLRRRK